MIVMALKDDNPNHCIALLKSVEMFCALTKKL